MAKASEDKLQIYADNICFDYGTCLTVRDRLFDPLLSLPQCTRKQWVI